MKLFQLLAISAVLAFSANVFAQAPGQAAKGIKITKITGTVNIMKDGAVVMTLKPGDAIPEITDKSVTFSIVDGTVEIEAGGKKISGATGSNFTVSANAGQTNVALGAGTPVAVKTESGQNIILTANSEVKMINANGNVMISMEKGNAVMTNASGGQTQTVQAGQTGQALRVLHVGGEAIKAVPLKNGEFLRPAYPVKTEGEIPGVRRERS